MKLIQRHLFKGTREFEIVDDYVVFRSKAPFKEVEELTVMLTVLNPEPIITRSSLDFTSRVNGETLLSFYLGKPNAQEFNAFIGALKDKALNEYQSFAGLKSSNASAALGANVYDEPPSFDDPEQEMAAKYRKDLDVARIDEAIQMINTYLKTDDMRPLLTALEALKGEPQNESRQIDVIRAFNALGPSQGAVLTYAPYVGILLSDGPAGSPY
jgi:hypothetical protein